MSAAPGRYSRIVVGVWLAILAVSLALPLLPGSDGLVAVYAIFLGMPWSLMGLSLLDDDAGPGPALAVCAAGGLLNGWLLYLGLRWLGRRSQRGS